MAARVPARTIALVGGIFAFLCDFFAGSEIGKKAGKSRGPLLPTAFFLLP